MAKRKKQGKERLTALQKRFCLEYLQDRNGEAAAGRAGYSTKNAKVQACRLLKNANVLKYIKELEEQEAKQLCITSAMITKKLMDVYENCAEKVPVKVWDSEAHAYVDGDELKMRDPKNALAALDKISERLGLADDRGDSERANALYRALSGETK